MMNETGFRRVLPEQSFGSGHTFGTPRHASLIDPILSKRVCFYKSGDPQFNGLRMVINNRTFKTFDTLLDSLSKKVPLPFGVRNITTPRGIHAVHTLDELEDGKSYICSDSRKVKPINLAVARRKLAPWYNARPVSSRRRTVQQARFFPGRNFHKQESMLVRTPKTLLVFRNGDPTVEHSVVLRKRTTPTFESIQEYISELMQFHVRKLHTADGRRVDGLPGLMLCSGTVVAAGREPFRHANYNVQKSPAETALPTKRLGRRRRKVLKRKKKSQSYTPKSRNFSLSSERYIVNRIHNSIAGSSCDQPSPCLRLESGHMLDSVPETPDTCMGVGAEEQDRFLPTEDDIEKSFRVNQDGSMTVEMRVRLTIKEEETIHWTTTLARSSVANQQNFTCLSEPVAEQEISSLKSNSLDLERPAATIDINKDKTQDNNDEDPPSLGNGVFSESNDEEDASKVQTNTGPPRSAPTPGHKQIRKKQASVESIKSVMVEGIQEGVVGSYAYREQTENGAVTEQYCMVQQKCSRPVPKPRRHGSVDANNINGVNVSPFKSAGRTEIRQIESSGEEVSETVLHVYEQQTCQDNFFANLCSEGMSAFGIPFGRPATSETGQLSSHTEFEPQPWRPSTASESISIWRTASTSVASDLTSPSLRTVAIQANGESKPRQREVNKDKRVSAYLLGKPKVIHKRVRRLTSPRKRRKEHSAGATEKSNKVKTFSSAGFIKKIYGNKSKSAKSTMQLRKGPTENGDRGVTTGSSRQSDDTIKCILKDSNMPSALKETTSETVSFEECSLNVAPNEVSQPRGILRRQTSMQQEKKKEKESYDVSESMSLPAFNSSSAVTNEYVENWLEKARLNPSAYPNEESKKIDVLTLVQRESGRCVESDNKKGLMLVADEAKCLEDTSGVPTGPLPRDELGASVKQRIRSLENKSSSQPMERGTVKQVVDAHETTTNTENDDNSAHTNTDAIKPLFCSEIILPINETSTEISAGSEMENKSSQIKILFQKETPPNSFSMELPPPPPPVTDIPNAEYTMTGASSVAVSSQTSDKQPLTIRTKADEAVSTTDHTMEMTASIHSDTSTQSAAPLPRTPSIKRAPLVSNKSLDRKMSLRKACLDKYTSCSDATSETSTSSAPINAVADNVLPSGICLTGTQPPSRLSCCTSASPTSLTSEERMSSFSISSSEAPTPSDLPLKEIKTDKTPFCTQKEALPHKPLVKHVKRMSSPSPERKSQTKKIPSELPHNSPKVSSLHNHPADIGSRRQSTPNASPSTERKPNRPKLHTRRSPYSQSLDMASQLKSSGRLLSRNLSSDNASEPTNKTQSQTPSQRRRHQTPQSINSTDELEKTLTCNTLMPLDAEQSDDSKMTDDLEKSIKQRIPQPLNIANRPKMKPVLEKICYSIKSIRQITQNKRLEKSNSLPDFSSHVVSTFGSSSKALLAFLSVMTLKEGLADINMDELNADDVSCAEALKMIDSLRRIASIEDSHELKVSLSNLQQSASKQLLQSWKGFQDLGDKCKSRSSTPNNSEQGVVTEAGPEKDCGIDKNVIDEIVDTLDIPERLKEELTSLSKDKSDGDDVEPKDNSNAKGSRFSTEDAVNVRDVAQEEDVNMDVSSGIKEFTDVNQPKQSSAGSRTKDTEDKDCLYEQIGAYQCPPDEPTDTQTPEEQELYSTAFFAKDNRDKSNPEKTKRNGSVRSKKSLEQDSGTSDMEGHRLQMYSEESISDNELTRDEESVSDEGGQHRSSATNDLEQKVLCKLSASSSEAGEQHSSEEEPEGECEVQQESRGGGHPPNDESHSEEEEDEQPSSNYYSEVNGRGKERILLQGSHSKSSSEEEQQEVECQAACVGSNVSVDSDVDDPSSEEEQEEVECKKLKVIIEESVSDNEKEEEEHRHNLPVPRKETRKYRGLKTLIEEEDKVSSEEEVHRADETNLCDTLGGDPSHLIENQDSYTKKDKISLIKSDSSTKTCGYNADEDSGNDHSSCEEHAEMEQPTVKDKPTDNSSSDDKESSSEEEHADVDTYTEESCTEYQEAPAQSKDTKCEKVVEKLKHQTGKIISQSVAERVILLEKQVADAQKTTEGSVVRRFSQRNAPLEPDVEDSPSESPTSQSAPATRSAPQSSLSFSYDSSGIGTSETEGNKVRSIRDMFLAKSATDIQPRCFPRSNTSETRTETSASGGYQSQTSSELSSSEDDSARKSITKGFVRRTIERLYGKKDARPDEEASERPPSAPKQQKKEHLSIFSPFHVSRSKAMSEMSYFNSTNAADTLSEATRCVAFSARVGPEDRVSLDNEQWFFRENDVIRKSVSDPVGIHKNAANSQGEAMREGTEESSPYSLFSSKSEQEDTMSSLSRKCTYFSLPHMSDSDAYQDDLNTVGKSSASGDIPVETKEATGTRAESNRSLPGVGLTEFKMKDNKVHPLVQPPPDGEVVVVQPGKGQGVMSRRIQEPDVLDILYTFCGQNCPIL